MCCSNRGGNLVVGRCAVNVCSFCGGELALGRDFVSDNPRQSRHFRDSICVIVLKQQLAAAETEIEGTEGIQEGLEAAIRLRDVELQRLTRQTAALARANATIEEQQQRLAAAEADILAWQTTATYCGEIRDEALAKLAAAEALLRDREEAANWCFHWICTVKHFREAFEHWPWLRDHGDTTRSREVLG